MMPNLPGILCCGTGVCSPWIMSTLRLGVIGVLLYRVVALKRLLVLDVNVFSNLFLPGIRPDIAVTSSETGTCFRFSE